MATQYVFAVGKMIASQPPAAIHIDTRLAELLDWRRETGQELPLPADLIVWLEDRGYVTDLLTGRTSRLEPLQEPIDASDDVPDGTGLAYTLGQNDYAAGRYLPPFAHDEHVAYIKGQNDAWAAAKNVTWWRKSER
jgi:hypothetical protein